MSLEVSATLESKMEESAKLVLPVVDVNAQLSAIVLFYDGWKKNLNKITKNEHNC